jgi:hypothetical protein
MPLLKRQIWPIVMIRMTCFYVVDSCVNNENSWIMDTSASQHITPNKD